MKFYYRTMFDGRIRSIDLNRIHFDFEEVRTHAIGPARFIVEDATPPDADGSPADSAPSP